MYELTRVNSPEIVATSPNARPLLDAAVLGWIRYGGEYRIRDCWTSDGRHGPKGETFRKVRFGVDAMNGAVWRLDGSGVPETLAASAGRYLDGAHGDGRRFKAEFDIEEGQ